MTAIVAAFEWRYQLRGTAWRICVLLFLLLSFIVFTVPNLSLGGGHVHHNAPYLVLVAELSFSLMAVFPVAAIAVSAILRDQETTFAPILFTSGIRQAPYLIGRFLGSYAACVLVLLGVPIGAELGAAMPWNAAQDIGPYYPGALCLGFLVIVLPNLLFICAAMFTAAAMTRRMIGPYVVALTILLFDTLTNILKGMGPWLEKLAALIDPMADIAQDLGTRYWTILERNTLPLPLTTLLIFNRLIWIGISLGLLVGLLALFRFRETPPARRRKPRSAAEAAIPAFDPTHLPRPRFGVATMAAQFGLRLRFEMAQVARSPGFIILLLLGLIFTVVSTLNLQEMYGTPAWPVTPLMIKLLRAMMGLFGILIVTFYAGDVVWREKEHRIEGLIGATPVPDWVMVLSKVPAISLLVFALLLASVLVAMGRQLLQGYTHLEALHYLLWFVLPVGVQLGLIVVLATFFQVISPRKYIGWGLIFLFIVSRSPAAFLGWNDILYTYGATPGLPLSGMNGVGRFWVGVVWSDLYWGCVAILLLVACQLLWRRAGGIGLRARLSGAARRMTPALGGVALLAFLCAIGCGHWIYLNTHVWNRFTTTNGKENETAAYEKALIRYVPVPQPSVSAVKFVIDLYPRAPEMTVRGRYELTNRTNKALTHVHVRMLDDDTHLEAIAIEGAQLEREYPRFHYRIYAFDHPLAPGTTTVMTFRTRRGQTGFRNKANTALGISRNGTFVRNMRFAPLIGMNRIGLISDPAKRRRHHLPPAPPIATLEDKAALGDNYIHADWTTADITVTTDADQTPVAPGARISDVTHDGRRTAHFVTQAPVLNFFAVQSARYAERHATYTGPGGPIALTVFHDPKHSFNVDRMISGLKAGLAYDIPHFGPYQFSYVRIVEFPGYANLAQAFAGTIPYSENIGFIANLSKPERIDYVTYVTAHELGHQWWAHQLIGADMQGATMLSESLAQYSALMAMRQRYGDSLVRRFLKYERKSYLGARGRQEEYPLARVEDEPAVYYNKGALVMYRLQDVIDQDRVNAALRSLLARYRFRDAPYPRSIELVNAFKAQAPGNARLIADLFTMITLYDLKAARATATRRPGGGYDVAVTLSARKLHAGRDGKETDALMDEPVMLRVSAEGYDPNNAATASRAVTQTVRLRSGRQTVHIVTPFKPGEASVDPDAHLIDRDEDNNTVTVTLAAPGSHGSGASSSPASSIANP